MVELAFVLVLKQKQEWVNAIEHVADYDVQFDKVSFKNSDDVAYDVTKRPTFKKIERNVHKRKDQERAKASFSRRMLGMFHTLPFMIKIDFVAFLLFYLFFFLVNCIYWPAALNERSKDIN